MFVRIPGLCTILLPRAPPGSSHMRRWAPWRRPRRGSDKSPPHCYRPGASHLQILKLLAAVARCVLVKLFECILNLMRAQNIHLFFKYLRRLSLSLTSLYGHTNAFESILLDKRHQWCRLAWPWGQGQPCLEAILKFLIEKERQRILSSIFHLSKPVQFSKGIKF